MVQIDFLDLLLNSERKGRVGDGPHASTSAQNTFLKAQEKNIQVTPAVMSRVKSGFEVSLPPQSTGSPCIQESEVRAAVEAAIAEWEERLACLLRCHEKQDSLVNEGLAAGRELYADLGDGPRRAPLPAKQKAELKCLRTKLLACYQQHSTDPLTCGPIARDFYAAVARANEAAADPCA